MDSIPGLELFNSYEQEFNDLVISIRNAVNVEAKNLAGEPRKAVLRRTERELEEAEEIVSQMEVEVQSLDKALKPSLSGKLKSFRNELSSFKKQIKQAQAQSNLTDSGGFSPSYTDLEDQSSNSKAQAQRERLLRTRDILESGTDRLESSHRIALETEELGTGILRDLRSQREQIEGTRDTLREADGHIDKASGTLNKMIRRMHRQRIVTGSIIAVLVLLILFILYSKFR
ncbi:t-SNARE [Phakopsora pachyrhizi]|uniref:t-SNARE n=1 Tax=Phakopsora pachyrhizi TaxID=170000 RepID=A0AAV0AHF2_PHAPC|nr:t-SNARE [Phakopsora pachyrhizi]